MAKLNNHMQPREEYWWFGLFPKAPFACIRHHHTAMRVYHCSRFHCGVALCAHTRFHNIYICVYYKCWEMETKIARTNFHFRHINFEKQLQYTIMYSRTNRIFRPGITQFRPFSSSSMGLYICRLTRIHNIQTLKSCSYTPGHWTGRKGNIL